MIRNFTIRDINTEDLTLVYRMGLKVFHGNHDDRAYPQWSADSIAEIISKKHISLVALQRKKMLGFLISEISLRQSIREARIIWLAVEPVKFEQEIREKLYDEFLKRVNENDSTSIYSIVSTTQKGLYAFFQEKGFTEKSKYVVIEHFLPKIKE